jgi:hypothetical protein
MATIFTTIKRTAKGTFHNPPHGTSKRGWKGFLVDKGERYGAAAFFGFSKGYFGNKFLWKGHGLDAWIGLGALLVSTGLTAYSNGSSRFAPHLERIGDAGLMSAIGSLSAAYGLEKAGSKVAVVKTGAGKKIAGTEDVLGAIAAAKAGPYLSQDVLNNFAGAR